MSSKNGPVISMSGFYWFHFDTFTNKKGEANYTNTYGASDLSSKLVRTSVNDTNNDVLSCDSLLFMTKGSHVSVLSTTDLYVPAESLYSVTFFGFIVNSDFSFFVYGKLQVTQTHFKPFIFSKIVINKGDAWNKRKSVFFIPVDGIYFFNFHASSLNKQKLSISVKYILSYLYNTKKIKKRFD